jgi:hypothetical protein
MPNTLDISWDMLLPRIESHKCTPFLGAGACFGTLPLGGQIARQWADEYNYPLQDCDDLARVAQFLAVRHDPVFPKERFLRQFIRDAGFPDFTAPDEPHAVLASLPLPVFVTTNYDSFMLEALRNQGKDPRPELCRWNKYVTDQPSIFEADDAQGQSSDFEPSPETPVVFYLHGHQDVPESLVLSETDYLDFLVNLSRDEDLVPTRIRRALTGSSLLFIGYALRDWSFRVLYQGLLSPYPADQRRCSVAVQLPREDQAERSYLAQYFGSMDVRVYWGTARQFSAELRTRWEEFPHGP